MIFLEGDLNMAYHQEVADLATRYSYSYDVCKHVYLAHGDKAEEILKEGAENNLSGFWVMQLSDVCYNFAEVSNNKELEAEIDSQPVININELRGKTRCKEGKLPRKLKAGWKL